jgi:hypothetical protein
MFFFEFTQNYEKNNVRSAQLIANFCFYTFKRVGMECGTI